MNGKYLLIGAALMGFSIPPGAANETTGCDVTTQNALATTAGLYLWGAKEVWQEGNGVLGLQRASSYCQNGHVIPPDLCITHSENNALLACSTGYALGVLT